MLIRTIHRVIRIQRRSNSFRRVISFLLRRKLERLVGRARHSRGICKRRVTTNERGGAALSLPLPTDTPLVDESCPADETSEEKEGGERNEKYSFERERDRELFRCAISPQLKLLYRLRRRKEGGSSR